MPSLFSRRRGSSQPPPMRASITSSAAAAASQAYIQKNGSSAALSSAAAAAALRSLTSSPEPVGSIQTKRMMRRGSVSSVGGASVTSARGHPPLSRRDSQASMSERTFRSPSPGRTNSMRLSSLSNAPPVPAVPRSVSTRHHRANSLDQPTRALSPQNNNVGRTMSMDSKTMPLSLRAPKATRLSNVSELEERSERLDSRNSVNFSRPMQSPPASPITAHPEGKSKYTHGAGGWFSGATGAAVISDKATSRPTVANGIEANSGKKMIPVDTHNPSATQPPPVQYETYMAFDPNTRTFVPKQRVAQKAVQPPSPQLPTAQPLAPGSWDPHTRSIVPTSTPGGQVSQVMQPPPRNPKRLSMESLPQSPFLKKDADKILEDDRNSEVVLLDTGEKVETSVGPANLVVSSAHQRHVSLDVPRQSIETIDKRRQASVSPHRTRFSPSPVSDSIRHKPPPRSMSPVKSAMKPSPASSLRATSPLPAVANLTKVPSGDASDAASLASRDGTPKPKKSVRVSFDERAQEVSIPDTSLEERLAALDQHDMDTEIMAPRPALPSFGSVRSQRGASPSTSPTPPPAGSHKELKSDQAARGTTPTSMESTPAAPSTTQPEIAAASKSVSISGTEATTSSEHQHESSISEIGAAVKSRDFAQTLDRSPEDKELPDINLLPPTPGIDEDSKKLGEISTVDEPNNNLNRNSMEGIVVPGGWGSVDKTKIGSAPDESQNDLQSAVSFDEPLDHRSVGLLDAITEDTDDEFSDAAEDLTEDEGGFASLNAIANSPVVIPKDSGKEASSVPNSPIVDRTSKSIEPNQAVGGAKPQDWEATTSYWSRLSQTQREQMEKERLSIDDGETTPTRATFNTTSKSDQPVLKPILKNTTPTPISLAPIDEPRAMRRSMRDTPELSAVSASTSNDGEVRLRRSMRESVNGTALSARPAAMAQRPASVLSNHSSVGRPDASSRSALKAATDGSFSAKMEQKYTNDSDSESSFRKKKRAASNVDAQGRYNMKRSMRATAGNPDSLDEQRPLSPEVPRKKDRALSVRSLSPSGSFFGGRAKSERIRESLRGNTDNEPKRTTLRGNASAARPASIASAGRSRFRSRFADSDDSDDDRATTGRGLFRSRFADSDDDEPSSPTLLRADLTPVRGIPKPAGQYDGDSTDLEEEAQEAPRRKPSKARDKMRTPLVPESADIEKAMEAARIKLGIPKLTEPVPSAEGQALQKGSLRRDSIASADARAQTPTRFSSVEPIEEKKKRGFMGILRKNRSSTQSVPQISSGAVDDAPPVPPLPNGVQPAPILNNDSPKGKVRPVRRLQRGDSTFSTATAPAYMSAAGNDLSDSWPLPPTDRLTNGQALHNGDRPRTSDGGVSQAGRSGKAVRIAGVDEDESGIKGTRDVYSMRTGRKKKFGMLRRAFGLND